MQFDPNEPVFSKKVIEVLTISNEFCLLIEKAETYERTDFLLILHRILPLLYLKASLLTNVEASNPEIKERFVNEEQYELIYHSLKRIFGSDDRFKENVNNISANPGSFSEYLSDVYQDIKDFLVLYQKPSMSAKENAINECLLFFKNHWGYRALMSVTNIHPLLYPLKDNS
jgi:hypothetical protein